MFYQKLLLILIYLLYLFADDANIFKEIKNSNNLESLQNYLNSIHGWCVKNNLFFNINKCINISFFSKEKSLLSNILFKWSRDSNIEHCKWSCYLFW